MKKYIFAFLFLSIAIPVSASFWGGIWGPKEEIKETKKEQPKPLMLFGGGGEEIVVSKTSGAQSFELPNGTVSAPSLTFTNDTNTGLYRIGADNLGFSTGGTERLRINADGQVRTGGGQLGTVILGRIITTVASGTIAIGGLPARDHLKIKITIPSMDATSSPTLSFNGATSSANIAYTAANIYSGDVVTSRASATFPVVMEASSGTSDYCGYWQCDITGEISGTSTVRKSIKTDTAHSYQVGSDTGRTFSIGYYDVANSAIHEVKLTCGQAGENCGIGTEFIIEAIVNDD